MTPQRVSLQELLARLERAKQALGATATSGALAFDADGTLWSGDVGEDVFLAAIAEEALRPAALSALHGLALRYGVERTNDPSQQAGLLFEGYRRGIVPEDVACEMMAWGYAGWDQRELATWVSDVLHRRGLSGRYYSPLVQVIDWGRDNGLATVVVSASPNFVIEIATAPLGFGENDIVGCKPQLAENGAYLPALTSPLPYGQTKADALRRLLPDTHIVASFGDSAFDLALLATAEIPVAVRPKPALVEQLRQHPRVIVLTD
jgi:phosphoserine phosphatase